MTYRELIEKAVKETKAQVGRGGAVDDFCDKMRDILKAEYKEEAYSMFFNSSGKNTSELEMGYGRPATYLPFKVKTKVAGKAEHWYEHTTYIVTDAVTEDTSYMDRDVMEVLKELQAKNQLWVEQNALEKEIADEVQKFVDENQELIDTYGEILKKVKLSLKPYREEYDRQRAVVDNQYNFNYPPYKKASALLAQIKEVFERADVNID